MRLLVLTVCVALVVTALPGQFVATPSPIVLSKYTKPLTLYKEIRVAVSDLTTLGFRMKIFFGIIIIFIGVKRSTVF